MNKDFKYYTLSPFKWFMLENFPFIEADFDALTNWQLFCKLGKEMNKIIDSTNTLGTQVESLTDYVNNYFDNLDIQEELNIKLDEMAESGELAELISQYLELQSIIGYNNINELSQATNLLDGSYARTLGKNTYNDGLGSFYKIRQRLNSDVIDNYNIISLVNTTNLVAERIISQLEKEIQIMKNKNVIMIGDSYANRTNSWQDRIKSYAGLTDDNCNMQRISGVGFVNTVDGHNFRTMLTEGITIEPEKVTDIIVCGGYNDISADTEVLQDAIRSFMETCKNTYPNANVYVGFLAWCTPNLENYSTRLGQLKTVLDDYSRCGYYYEKAHYLNNVEFSLHLLSTIDDSYFHPNETGQLKLALNIMRAWVSGSTSVNSSQINVTSSFTPDTNITLANGVFYSIIDNGISRLFSQNYLQFVFDQNVDYNLNSDILLGTITNGYVQGRFKVTKCVVDTLVRTVNNGYFHIPATIVMEEGKIYLRLKVLNRNGNEWLTDNLNYIKIEGFNMICDSMTQY